MTFQEKLILLTEDMNKAAIARRMGIKPPGFHEYLSKGVVPRIDTAARIAKALRVDIAWLIDDTRSWPPVRVDSLEPAHPVAA